MNLVNKLSNIVTFGMLCLCAASAYYSYRTHEDMRRLRSELKKIDRKLSDTKKAFDKQNTVSDGFVTAFRMNMINKDQQEDIEMHEYTQNNTDDEGLPYTVREYNGIIGIFDDEEEFVRSIDKKVASLSAPDRQSLLLGIRAESESELEKILESFG